MAQSIRRVAAAMPLLVAVLLAPPAGHAEESAEHRRCSSCHVGERPTASEVSWASKVIGASTAGQLCGGCHSDIVSNRGNTMTTPTAHADCGSCHAPHGNGQPFQLKIALDHAQPAESAGLDDITRLCQSCHGEIARTRGPRGHFIRHPVGLRLARGRRTTAARLGLPLVDTANTADPSDDVLSCITCHDVHDGDGAYRLRWTADSEPVACRGCHTLDRAPALVAARTEI